MIHGPANVPSDSNVGRLSLAPTDVERIRYRVGAAQGRLERRAAVLAMADSFGVSDRTVYKALHPGYGTPPRPARIPELVPVTLGAARAFVGEHHRHNRPPQGWLFGVGIAVDGDLRGVAIAGRPIARRLQDGRTVEITRVCTLGDRNASSRLYGAVCRAAAALGYRVAITYTLESEPGSSLEASGFRREERHQGGGRASWANRRRPRHDVDLWGDRTLPDEPRVRWSRAL